MTADRAHEWYAARAVAGCAGPLPAQLVDLGSADRRVLAADVVALTDLPAFATSAMDGWAVAGDGPWQVVVGAVLAGRPPEVTLLPGQACLIATGAAVPEGADAVVRREAGALKDGHLQSARPGRGADIRPQGEECRTGDVLAVAGARISPAVIGSLAAGGVDKVAVRAQPRVAIVLFGDELAHSGVAPAGRVRDALGPQLPGWLDRLGARTIARTVAADTLAEHVAAIRAARPGADVVITTGGTAAGPVDHLHTAIAELGGRLLVDMVAVRPGHPMAMADLGEGAGARWLVALPGNPMSAVVTLLTLGAPLIDSLLGRPSDVLGSVTLADDVSAPAHEHRLVPCRLAGERAEPVAHLGSAMMRGLAQADGFAVLPPGGARAADRVDWLPLPR